MAEQDVKKTTHATETPVTVVSKKFGKFHLSPLSSKRFRLVVVSALIVAVIIVGSTWLLVRQHNKTVTTPTKQPVAKSTPGEVYQSLRTQGNYAQMQQALQTQIAHAGSPTAQSPLYMQLAYNAIIYKKYDEAEKYAQQAQEADPNASGPYAALALTAQYQNDSVIAKKDWQLAIDHLDKTLPQYSKILKRYNAGLQGGGI